MEIEDLIGTKLEDMSEEELNTFLYDIRRSKKDTISVSRVKAVREKNKQTNTKTMVENLPPEQRAKIAELIKAQLADLAKTEGKSK